MIDFIIASRFNINHIIPESNHIIISATEPENVYPELNTTYCLDFIRLVYTDEDKPDEATFFGRSQYMFSNEQAKNLLDFAFRYKDNVDCVISQCDGGISRSSGTAAALSVVLNGSRTDNWIFESRKYIPNMFVYRKILNMYEKYYLD